MIFAFIFNFIWWLNFLPVDAPYISVFCSIHFVIYVDAMQIFVAFDGCSLMQGIPCFVTATHCWARHYALVALEQPHDFISCPVACCPRSSSCYSIISIFLAFPLWGISNNINLECSQCNKFCICNICAMRWIWIISLSGCKHLFQLFFSYLSPNTPGICR